MSTAAPIASDLSAQRDLAVAGMNHGHALLQYNDPACLTASLQAYAQAIALLQELPLAENPSWANSLGAAWMNHGQLLHRVHGIARAEEAFASFDAADIVLRPLLEAANPWARRNLAGTLLNRSNLLLDLARPAEAAKATRESLAFSLPHERSDLVDTDLALKARRTLCDALGQLLVAPGADQDALATEASDLVDDGLALTRLWADRGEKNLQPLAVRFFRYGTQLYRRHQPHFLVEFIAENHPRADRELRAIALDAINAALADRPRDGAFLTMGDPATERRLQTWRELETLRDQLVA